MKIQPMVVIGVIALSLVAALFTFLTYLIGPYAWDDGAITIAFARSLRAGGEFALTLASERVEGTSSLLHTVLIALFLPVSEGSFQQQIATSQALTAIAGAALGVVLFRALQTSIPSVAHRMLILALFLLIPMHLSETMNGMEMELFALLLTLFALAVRSRSRRVYVIIPLCLLTRFEAAFYLGFASAMLSLFDPDRRPYHARVLASTVICFGMLTCFRLIYFGDFLPNTVWAKMSPPYTPDLPLVAALTWKLGGLAEMIDCAAPLLIVATVAAAHRRKFPGKDATTWLIAGFAVFAVITGPNWGYQGRMFVGMLPLLLIATADIVAGRGPDLAVLRTSSGQIVILYGALLGTILLNTPLARANVTESLKAGLDRGLIPARLEPVLAARLRDVPIPVVVPWQYRMTGLHADAIRGLLGLDNLVFMVPDVGGLSLCCDPHALTIVDLALLTNVSLAKSGYANFEAELRERNPELIETHSTWSEASRIYDSQHFQREYRPVIYGNTLFWLRSDLLEDLTSRRPEILSDAPSTLDLAHLRNDFDESDINYLTQINRHPIIVIAKA